MFWEFIRTIFASPAGSFAFVAALLALSYWLVHYVTKKVEQWSAKVERVEKMENVIDSIKEDLHYIKATLNVLQSVAIGEHHAVVLQHLRAVARHDLTTVVRRTHVVDHLDHVAHDARAAVETDHLLVAGAVHHASLLHQRSLDHSQLSLVSHNVRGVRLGEK